MRIDVTQVLLSFEGTPIHNNGQEVTLKAVCCNALMADGDSKLSGEEKLRRHHLARRVFAEGTLDMTPEEVSLLRTLIANTYGTVIVGPAWELLDPPRTN